MDTNAGPGTGTGAAPQLPIREADPAPAAHRRKLSLLFVTSSLVHGGAERHTITLFNRLAENGHQCHLAFVKDQRDQILRLRPCGAATVRGLDARKFVDGRAIEALGAAIMDAAPSVIVAVNEYALMYAVLAQRHWRRRAALAVTYHAMRAFGAKEHLKMLTCRPLFWSADCAIFVCGAQRRRWLRRGVFSRRNEVIHNGIDIDEFSCGQRDAQRAQTRASLGISEADYVIGLAAGLRPEKNHMQLVDAVARLRGKHIPARALLIGDGEMRRAIEARAAERGISAHVMITGFQADVRPFVEACDVVALCSFTEAFSLAAIEAMALNRPVVHSAVGGAAEMIVTGWNGYLYPAGNLDALVEKLALLSDRELSRRMGCNARALVERSFTEKRMVTRYERLLLELAGNRA